MAEDGSVVIKVKGDDSDFQSKLKSIGSAVGTTMKATVAAVGAASAGIAALGTACINAYADYEQLAGGVETLFQDSAETIHSFADNAYKTAGLSANEYMETVTGFSASLLQSLGGDTAAAAQTANLAITDMADNANKMGTAMESIQYAYQGFAKQNYTMLDNLKLGYGGTKEEMQRLLADAQKLSGVKYDLNSFSDIVEAIHVIQTEMDITGTTAKEASTTIQGSVASMKAAWANLMVGMADDTQDFDMLLSNFIESIGTVADNLLPRIGVVIEGMGKLVAGLAPQIAAALPTLTNELLPNLVELGIQAVGSLVQGIQENSDSLAAGALSVVGTLGAGIVELLPMLADTAAGLVVSLADGIAASLPTMVPVAVQTIGTLVENLTANADTILQAGISIILALGQGIINAIPTLIETVPQIVISIANVINDNAPRLLGAALSLIVKLVEGLWNARTVLLENIGKIIEAIVAAFMAFQWLNLGKSLIEMIANGVKSVGSFMQTAAKDIFAKFKAKLTGNEIAVELKNIGKYILEGIVQGVKGSFARLGELANALKDQLLGFLKERFRINSPSKLMRDEVGRSVGEGIAVGIEESGALAVDAAEGVAEDIVDTLARKQDDLQSKLTDYGSLFERVQTEDGKELFKLGDLEEDIRRLEQYGDALDRLRERGLSDGLMSEIADMGVGDALDYMDGLISLSDTKFDEYVRLFEQKQQTAQGVAEKFYKGEFDALEQSYAEQIPELLAGVRSEFSDVGVQAAENLNAASEAALSDGMQEQEPAVVESARVLTEAAKEEIAGYWSDFRSIGESLMEGVAKGVRDGQSGVVNAIADALRAAVAAARAEMDINSPSRVMAKIGDYMAQGVGVGWSERMEGVSATIGDSLSDGLEQKMTAAYEKMRAAASQNMLRLRGDIAVQRGGDSTYVTKTIHNNEGDTVLQIEHFHNDSGESVPGLMQEAEFYRRQRAMAKGGA